MATAGELFGPQEERQATRSVQKARAGKARNKAMKRLIQQSRTLASVRPPGGKPFHGMPGEIHIDTIERYGKSKGMTPDESLDKLLDVFYQSKSGKAGEFTEHTGFTDVQTGEYMTREETAQKFGGVGEAESQITKQRSIPSEVRVAHGRRGVDPISAEKLRTKRIQTNRLLQNLNRGIRGASTSVTRGRLLNRRGLVRQIAKKSKYLGLAIAAGDAVSNMLNTNKER